MPAPKMSDLSYLSQRSAAELREQAAGYRCSAKTARTLYVSDALIKIADRLDALADQHEQEQHSGGAGKDE
jgi:hypothetical protein